MNTKNTSMTPLVETVAQLERYVTSLIPKLQQAAQLGGQLASSMSGGAGGFVHGSQSMPQGIAQMAGSTYESGSSSQFSCLRQSVEANLPSITTGGKHGHDTGLTALNKKIAKEQDPATKLQLQASREQYIDRKTYEVARKLYPSDEAFAKSIDQNDINRMAGHQSLPQEAINKLQAQVSANDTPKVLPVTARAKMMSGFYGASDELHREIARGNAGKARGLDIYDLEKIRQKSAGSGDEGMQKDIQRVMATGTDSQKNIARVAEQDLKRKAALAEKYTDRESKLLAAQASGADSEVIAKAQRSWQNMGQALADVTVKVDKAAKTLKGFGDGVGGGGGEQGMSPATLHKLKQGAQIGAGVLTAIAGTALAYEAVKVAALQENVGKERALGELEISRKGLADTRFTESFDLQNPENIIKYRGDIMSPGRYKYQGKTGLERMQGVSDREVIDRMVLNKELSAQAGKQLVAGLVTGAAMTGVGVAGTVGSYGLGAAMGVPVAAAGVAGMFNSFESYFKMAGTNEWEQLHGGISGGLGGRTAYSKANADKNATVLARTAAERFMFTKEQLANEGQKQEIANDPLGRMAASEIQKMVSVQQQGSVLVGTHARTRDEMLKALFVNKTGIDDQVYTMPGMGKGSLVKADLVGAEKERRIAGLRTSIDSALTSGKDVGVIGLTDSSIPTQQDALRREKAVQKTAAGASFAFPYSLEFANAPNVRGETEASKRGMSVPEFAAKSYMLENVVNTRGQASIAQTGQMIDMSRSGLGDFSALMGNVAGLNQVSGGQNNVEQLKSILSTTVSMGFDRSRTAQAFVQTSTQLADSLKLTRVDIASAGLKDAVKWQSATGMADEMALSRSASGMKKVEELTSSDSGLLGGAKALAMMESGLSPQRMAGLQNVGVAKAREMLADLSKFGNQSRGMDINFTKEKITQNAVELARSEVLREQGIDPMSRDPEVLKKREAFLSTIESGKLIQGKLVPALTKIANPYDRILSAYFTQGQKGSDYEKTLKQYIDLSRGGGKGLSGNALKTYKQQMQDAQAGLVSSAQMIHGLGDQNAATEAVRGIVLARGGTWDRPSAGKLSTTIRESAKIFNDPAQIKMNQALGEVMERTSGAKTHWSRKQYSDLLQDSSIAAMTVNVGGKSIPLTSNVLKYMESGKGPAPTEMGNVKFTESERVSANKEIDSAISNIKASDAARSAEFQAQGEGAQTVIVGNATDIGEAVIAAQARYSKQDVVATEKAESAKPAK